MAVVATAGHVDHGKSSVLRGLTGMEPDRWAEERRRGLTIDLGFVWTEIADPDRGSTTVAFVDVPGHDSFLPNALCGIGVVDQVLFVVAADDGWSAQSQEHLEILDLLDRHGVAAVVTKVDLAGPERTAEVVEDVRTRLDATSLRGTPVVAVDALSGVGIEPLRATIAARIRPRGLPGRPGSNTSDASEDQPGTAADTRLWIDRAFTVAGAGTIVTGLLGAGRLTVGQEVEVAPGGLRTRIRGMQSLEQPVEVADAGVRVAVNLAGVGHGTVGRGHALVPPARAGLPTLTGAVDVQLYALPHTAIGRRGAWHLHVGTAATAVQVVPLLEDLEPGTQGPVRLELDEPLPLRAGDRVVLRDAGRHRTAGGGEILDPWPGPRRRGTERRLAHAVVLDQLAGSTDPVARLSALLDAHGGLRGRTQLEALVGPLDPQLLDAAQIVELRGHLVHRERASAWTHAVLTAAEAAADDQALEVSRLSAAATQVHCPAELAPEILEGLVRSGRLVRVGGRLVHRDHEASYLAARDARRRALLDVLGADPLEPPDATGATEQAAIPSFEVQQLVEAGEVVACGPLLFAASAVEAAVRRLRECEGRDGSTFTASEARQAWATSRRCAMPLLEHLRATGVTTFDGTHHRLVAS